MADAGRHQRLAELFERACELEGRERDEFLHRSCGADEHLRRELEALLSLDADSEAALATAAFAAPAVGGPVDEALLARLEAKRPDDPKYRVETLVAQGGMGSVLRVWDEDLRRALAMKTIRRRGAPGGGDLGSRPEQLERFLEEAQITGQLQHPGIVPVHELGLDHQGRVYFTMKLVEGEDFGRVIRHVHDGVNGWSRVRALGVLQKVCEAVAYAHRKGVIHRDLKPANVMVGRFGEVYVMDWGLARVLGQPAREEDPSRPASVEILTDRRERAGQTPDSPLYTMEGDVVGTPAYMAPEQASGHIENMGRRSDVYALGAMLYQLLTGRMPFTEESDAALDVLARVRAGPPRPILELVDDAPEELVAICDKAMARDPELRYADALELADELLAFQENRVVRAHRTGPLAELGKWVVRNRALAATLAVALTLALGGSTVTSVVLANKNEAISLARGDAEAKGDLAQRQANELLQLAAIRELRDLTDEADRLWPVTPKLEGSYASWLARARNLLDGLDQHRRKQAELESHALQRPPAADDPDDPRAVELAQLEEEIAEQRERASHIMREDEEFQGPRARQAALDLARHRIDQAGRRASVLREWVFETSVERWWHDQLGILIPALEGFSDLASDSVLNGRSQAHGLGVATRARFLEGLHPDTETGRELTTLWAEAVASIADPGECPDYEGLELASQFGLRPLGRDRESGLWEFAHLFSGEAPERDPGTGRLQLTAESGIVLVLIPGGSFQIGAQRDRSAPNYDPAATSDEAPVHELTLRPFFLSKYEMTQAQWRRFTGEATSLFGPTSEFGGRRHSLLHPLEHVSWKELEPVLARLGLGFPTEAQWEYAARAWTSWPWSSGPQRSSLVGVANLADASLARIEGASGKAGPEPDDGWAAHAPVDALAPNPFGLHHVHGNVWEWCREGYGIYQNPVFGPDSERIPTAPANRIIRGGSFRNVAAEARSSSRLSDGQDTSVSNVGVRPFRAIETP